MPTAPPKIINTRALTRHLHAVGAEVHTADAQGNPITKEEALARLLWDFALGGEVMERDSEGNMKRVVTKPAPWAIQYIYERKEGKAAPSMPDNETGVRAADKVRELSRQRLNNLANSAVAAVKGISTPPKFKPKAVASAQ